MSIAAQTDVYQSRIAECDAQLRKMVARDFEIDVQLRMLSAPEVEDQDDVRMISAREFHDDDEDVVFSSPFGESSEAETRELLRRKCDLAEDQIRRLKSSFDANADAFEAKVREMAADALAIGERALADADADARAACARLLSAKEVQFKAEVELMAEAFNSDGRMFKEREVALEAELKAVRGLYRGERERARYLASLYHHPRARIPLSRHNSPYQCSVIMRARRDSPVV